MASWFIPAVKAILPFVSPIVASALPVFTTRKGDDSAAAQEAAAVVQKQIAELQAAASQNALHVKELAEQLQNTVAALEKGAAVAEARFRQQRLLTGAALAAALLATVLALFALLAG